MLGKIFTKVTVEDEAVRFENDEEVYTFNHEQDCCESVFVKDIVGDIEDLVNTPILAAAEATSAGITEGDSYTWTFYIFRTILGTVNISWLGESNGYYSESVLLVYDKKRS